MSPTSAAHGGIRSRALLPCLLVGAWLSASGAASAQPSDPVAPFLGTWSGVFTTQDNDYWGAEDLLCFPGCSLELYRNVAALLRDPKNKERRFNELAGPASQAEEKRFAAMLTPVGRLIQAENSPETDPKLHCQPYGFVREVVNPLPLTIERDGKNLLIRYEEWSLLRTIYMDGRPHPQHQTPTLLGHSVGRVENGVLIVETARVTPDWYSDATHAGHSGELKGVERYTVRDNPKRLEVELTVEDPVTLTKPYVITKTWLFTPDVKLLQDSCSEFPGKF
ncbi:MAG TPA: hypothetical protein VHH11_11975 [Gammaproteobacteria bacterium]|jgi:hypothetical protein|nr:hypothetical protein [Gammaproteobacteria bacterium]